jgi:hypothetical protein
MIRNKMIKLPRLPVGYEKVPGLFPRYWDQAMGNIEKAVNEVLAIPEIQTAIDAANAAAASANAAAAVAQNTADNQASELSLVSSYIDPDSFTGDLISFSSTGSVTVKTHTRIYGNSTLNPSVSVTGSTFSVTGTAGGDIIRVYYSDPLRAGGAVTYITTVDPDSPLAQSGDTHSVGAGSVPGTGTNPGQYIKPPGYIDEQLL